MPPPPRVIDSGEVGPHSLGVNFGEVKLGPTNQEDHFPHTYYISHSHTTYWIKEGVRQPPGVNYPGEGMEEGKWQGKTWQAQKKRKNFLTALQFHIVLGMGQSFQALRKSFAGKMPLDLQDRVVWKIIGGGDRWQTGCPTLFDAQNRPLFAYFGHDPPERKFRTF